MLSKKRIVITVLIAIASFYLYVLYQVSYKPWVSTEFTLMGTSDSNAKTRASNKRDSLITHQYIVKNPPYSLKARYQMMEDFLKQQGDFYPKTGAHRVTYVFSLEGWYFIDSFPYVDYIDRSYLDNPITYKENEPWWNSSWFSDDFEHEKIPYGGASGFFSESIAKFILNSLSSECLANTILVIDSPYMPIDSLVKNIEYDSDDFNKRFYFFSEDYTQNTPKCEGVSHEGDNTNKGLRF